MYVYIDISQQHTKNETILPYSLHRRGDNGKLWHHPQHATRGNLTNYIIRVAISRSTTEILFLTPKFSGKQLTSKRGLLLAK